MKVHEVVAQTLLNVGVERLFGVMGDANMRYVALYRDSGRGMYVGTAHEAGAVAMADGYSRLSGRVGVATLTHGPGVTNCLTALTEAVRSYSSTVVLTGDTPPVPNYKQWLDLRTAAHLAGAAYRHVRKPESVVDDLTLAVRLAATTAQPVLVDIPIALMDAEVGPMPTASFGFGPWAPQATGPDADRLDAALGVIASSKRLVILAGRGALLSGARAEILALSEMLDAPVATTVMAMNYLSDSDLYLGIFGTESHSLAIEYISQADCVLVLGASLNGYTTANGDLLRGKAVVQCDLDPSRIGSRHPATVSVVSDVRVFVAAITEALGMLGPKRESEWAARLRTRLADFDPDDDFVDRTGPGGLDIRTAMAALARVLPPERALVTDIGRFKVAPWRHLPCSPGRFTQPGAYAAIGLGLAAAIGVSFALPDEIVVAVVGDGGLMQSLGELATAAEYQLPLVIIVANDGAYGAEYEKLAEYGHDPAYSLRRWPSFAEVAKGFGIDGRVVRTIGDIADLKPVLAELTSPILIDVRADPSIDIRQYR